MYLDIPFNSKDDIGNRLMAAGFEEHAGEFLRHHYGRENEKISVHVEYKITREFLLSLEKIAEDLGLRGILTQARQSLRLLDDPAKEPIMSLKSFESAIPPFLYRDGIAGWLFYYDNTDNYIPFVVTSINYVPSDKRNRIEAKVVVRIDANSSKKSGGRSTDINFSLSDIKGKTIAEAFADKRYFKETQEMHNEYRQTMDAYLKFQPMFGKQFVGTGKVSGDSDFGRSATKNLNGEKRIKMVNDDQDSNSSARFSTYTEYHFWESRGAPEKMFKEIPFHPYIKMFDLNNHQHYWALSRQLQEYQYNPALGDKLVLPDVQRDLIDILVDDMDIVMEDIVEGKSGGTTILCMGEPGVGKTLTAEIYSEVVERPLYRVHSGQLGTNPDSIEKNLDTILNRSERWGSILLIDEADVYIRQRDNSMDHNAIVAAFLRKLEYFNGLLFLTTNRTDDVDDAIKSRAMAIVLYEKPKANELARIWRVLSDQFKMDLKDSVIEQLVKHYPSAVGRDVKELLKLANRYHLRRGRPLDLETFRACAVFRGIEHR